MTVIAMLNVAPVVERSVSGGVAKAVMALSDSEMPYETNPVGTVIKADDIDELLATAGAAHKAVDGNYVSTFLKIDDGRTKKQTVADKVDAVEIYLGWGARSDRG